MRGETPWVFALILSLSLSALVGQKALFAEDVPNCVRKGTCKETSPAPSSRPRAKTKPEAYLTEPHPSAHTKTVTVAARSGGSVEIRDFYPSAERIDKDYVVIKSSPKYDLIYYLIDRTFLITLSDSNVRLARAKAESDFPEILDISTQEACNLRVSLTVPSDINEQYSGKDYGLSFCPWGIPF
ncbi:MAG: hypothetical protein ACRERD_00170 [Candidatus Binatia bacterium]